MAGPITLKSIDTPSDQGKGLPVPDPLSLGPVTFKSVDAPSDLPIGALQQKIVVIETVGGGRVTQSFGAQPEQVSWSGTFYQPGIDDNVSELSRMAGDGNEYLLAWRSYRYYAKVAKFSPKFNHANRCPYDITLEITRPETGSLSTPAPTSVDSQVSQLSDAVTSYLQRAQAADPTGAASFAAAVAAALAAIAQLGPITQATVPGIGATIAQIGIAVAAVNAYLASISSTSGGYVPGSQIVSSLTLAGQNIQRGQTTKSIQVQGTSLFEIAAQYYGDASRAFAIAQANGLPSPFLSSQLPTTITLPALP